MKGDKACLSWVMGPTYIAGKHRGGSFGREHRRQARLPELGCSPRFLSRWRIGQWDGLDELTVARPCSAQRGCAREGATGAVVGTGAQEPRALKATLRPPAVSDA